MLHGVVVASIEVFCLFHVSRHALRLALCDLGDPGWGHPWFPHSAVLLHSRNGMAMWFLCLFSGLFGFATPILELIQCYHLFLIDSHWTGPPITFLSVFLVLVFCLAVFLCVLLLWVFSCCWLCFCLNRDGCWTMYRSHTSSLLCHLPMAAICMHQLANLPVLCNMQSNVLNDLAKAKRRWTEKNIPPLLTSVSEGPPPLPNGTSCAAPHGQINCPADILPSYRWRNWDCHQTFRESVPETQGHPRSSAPADHFDNATRQLHQLSCILDVARSQRVMKSVKHRKLCCYSPVPKKDLLFQPGTLNAFWNSITR